MGVRSGDKAYNKFLADLDKAGAPAIIAEMQRQLDEYIAKK